MFNSSTDIFNVLILFFMTVALFALLGVKLFGSKNLLDAGGKQYFVNYFDSGMWVLILKCYCRRT